MVNVSRRMRQLTEMIQLKVGSGAVQLPPEIRRIHISFARVFGHGHLGPKLFWRNDLRRLKYYNPALDVSIVRPSGNPEEPATMTVYYHKPGSSTTSPDTVAPLLSETIDIKDKGPPQILDQILKIAGGTKVVPAEEDLETVARLKGMRKQSRVDRDISEKLNEQRRILAAKEARRKSLLAL
ncbi:hypothetical protein BJ875DRAFT_467253 [Amylocarpus encephaloides]|uniref:Ribosomal protein/NADH dehydrogenase domain-containing protein n=1 Tax=Amylocarpus encephaloides TaxID=45428 RepID=A0A9P7YFJ9_9HELO|nr:hypothetical protein BJ875DRAFT_467253 [Amylocarpus encephaloides]